MGQLIKDIADRLASPIPYTVLTTLLLVVVLVWRKQLTRPIVFISASVVGIAFFVFAWDDPNFHTIITKPDNVPIIILIASVIFFTWLALRRAVINDDRIARGEPTLEGELAKKKVFTWPDLVYTELICIVLFTALLMVWSISIQAPIEEPASQARTPNPSKAPWYFLGLQEMLVYFDPWIAGVLLPSFIVVGLCAIPFLDRNPKGNGYYTFAERPFAISFFMYGFLLLWVSLVIMGTFLRGPNWSFFGPFEYWDPHKLEPMVNVDLSGYFWIKLLDMPRPENPLVREAPGIVALLGYFLLLPPLLGKTLFKKIAAQLGPVRFNILMQLFLWTALVPLKMVLRWTVSLKYIVGIPEWFLNV
jgi:hypothetical protein